MTPLIELDNISRSFSGIHALSGVNFSLMPGEVHSLVGENGAGKSILMRVLGGEMQPDTGEIRLKGELVRFTGPIDAIGRGISIIHQEMALAPDLRWPRTFSLANCLPVSAGPPCAAARAN